MELEPPIEMKELPMKPMLLAVLPAFLFAVVGLLAAWGIAAYAPTPPTQRPDFERTMFILLPIGGAALGWFLGFLATPLTR